MTTEQRPRKAAKGRHEVIVNGRSYHVQNHDPQVLAKKIQKVIDRRRLEKERPELRARLEKLERAEAAIKGRT